MELTGKYKALADDLKKAVAAAEAAADCDDGGTCNFDCMMIHLPRWNQELIEAAAKAAGIYAFDITFLRVKHYAFSVPRGGQANRRTAQAEAMAQVMKEAGYAAGVYYQMD